MSEQIVVPRGGEGAGGRPAGDPAARDAGPWYREPWPWLLMAGPAAVIVAGVVTAWIAFATFDGLVADDYYRQGRAINQELKRSQRASDLGLSASVDMAAGRVVGDASHVGTDSLLGISAIRGSACPACEWPTSTTSLKPAPMMSAISSAAISSKPMATT